MPKVTELVSLKGKKSFTECCVLNPCYSNLHFTLACSKISGGILVQCQIEYQYVNLQLSWEGARQYCREHYADLATLENEEDVNKLQIPDGSEAWIGLFDDPASWKGVMTSDSNSWRWSSTETTSPGGYQNWAPGKTGLSVMPRKETWALLICGGILVQCQIEYQYVNLQLSWEGARQYCREHYADLATLENEEDVNKLQIPDGAKAWIGLFDDPASWKGVMTSDSNSWRWSSTGTTSPGGYQNWAPGDPNNYAGKELCIFIQNGLWRDMSCTSSYKFFCYTVQPSGLKDYILITTPMTWTNAQSYCRQNHHDLAMIESSAENQAVTNLLPSTTAYVWIGLYRVPWRWSNGSPSTYTKWASGEPNNNGDSESCAVQVSSLWYDIRCDLLRTFVCRKDLKTTTNIKVSLQTKAEMSDPVVQNNFLKVPLALCHWEYDEPLTWCSDATSPNSSAQATWSYRGIALVKWLHEQQ
ncbi:C-type mannose receptor 2-like [Boleophthalmus pectinirostris]|uniref:C-type mannose receptor 2-like n=1 Tax=Boleophthalmus pectinirostris TaxID=150288 RepID=UPI00242AEC3B|nr:C-type mannose receptor 2-like [Boleophthalmus pectinirostris]